MGDQLFNVNEQLVRQYLSEKLSKHPEVCSCEICQNDMMTLALNKLPNHYARTDAGIEFQKLKVQDEGLDNLLEEVIKIVAEKPRH